MEMFSEELRIMDRNTVKYMIEEQQQEIENQQQEIESQQQEIQSNKQRIESQQKEIKGLSEKQGNVVARFGLKLLCGATLVSVLTAIIVGLVI